MLNQGGGNAKKKNETKSRDEKRQTSLSNKWKFGQTFSNEQIERKPISIRLNCDKEERGMWVENIELFSHKSNGKVRWGNGKQVETKKMSEKPRWNLLQLSERASYDLFQLVRNL